MSLPDATAWLSNAALGMLGGMLLGLVALALICLPMLCSDGIYERLIPVARRTKDGPRWCYLILQLAGLGAAVALFECLS